MAKSLMEYFNREDRLGVLATSAKSGEVDCAYFGSPRMIDAVSYTHLRAHETVLELVCSLLL